MSTPNAGIPYLPPGALDVSAGVNVALNVIDALLQTQVLTLGSLTAPPAMPADGDLHIPGAGATGDWAGLDNHLVRYVEEGDFWQAFEPGLRVRIVIGPGGSLFLWTGASWAMYAAPSFESVPIVLSITPSSFGADTTEHLVNMPAAVDVGDLLICGFANDGNATVTTPGGWTPLDTQAQATSVRCSWFYKVAAGTEGGTTVDFETSANEHAAAQVHRIQAGTFDPATPPAIASTSGSSSTTQDVPGLAPSWAIANTLWLASCGADDDDEIAAGGWPLPNDQTFTESAATTTSCAIYSCWQQIIAGAIWPMTWRTVAAEEYASAMIAVRPAQGS